VVRKIRLVGEGSIKLFLNRTCRSERNYFGFGCGLMARCCGHGEAHGEAVFGLLDPAAHYFTFHRNIGNSLPVDTV